MLVLGEKRQISLSLFNKIFKQVIEIPDVFRVLQSISN